MPTSMPVSGQPKVEMSHIGGERHSLTRACTAGGLYRPDNPDFSAG